MINPHQLYLRTHMSQARSFRTAVIAVPAGPPPCELPPPIKQCPCTFQRLHKSAQFCTDSRANTASDGANGFRPSSARIDRHRSKLILLYFKYDSKGILHTHRRGRGRSRWLAREYARGTIVTRASARWQPHVFMFVVSAVPKTTNCSMQNGLAEFVRSGAPKRMRPCVQMM